ncbi:hypothetical protein P8605_32580, partial [Streptomyces sp. T-3]|nr:hypothetical protein [Streptomyces sp. T-3]
MKSHEHQNGPQDGPDTEGFAPDELALRRMLRGAVQEIEPSDNALDHLRHAVPARRARKRQAVVGMAAAALFIGTAVPALVHVTNSNGSSDANPSVAGHGSEVPGVTGGEKGSGDGQQDTGNGDKGKGDKDGKGKDGKKDKGEEGQGETSGSGASGGVDPSGTEAPAATACGAG